MTRSPLNRLARVGLLACLAALVAAPVAAQELNLYTTREPGLIQPLLDAFTEQSGVTVNSLFVRGGLAERVGPRAHGRRPTC